MTQSGSILRHRDQGTLIGPPASSTSTELQRRQRAQQGVALQRLQKQLQRLGGRADRCSGSLRVGGITRSRLGATGTRGSPSVASSCATGPEDVTPTGGSMERGAVNAADVSLQLTLAGCLICEPVSGVVL